MRSKPSAISFPPSARSHQLLAHSLWRRAYGIFQNKARLIVGLSESTLSLLMLQGKRAIAYEKIFLRETPEEAIQIKLKGLLNGRKPKETFLLLPRSEVLQKELLLLEGNKASLRKALEAILPYAPKEMAYGIRLEENGNAKKALLLALPEKPLQEKLLFLERIGISPDEIITEDQPLLWLCLERKERGPLLLLEEKEEEVLALFIQDSHLSFSRTFSRKESSFEDLLSELSLSLLERGEKPEKILLLGSFEGEREAPLLRHFTSPVERLDLEEGEDIPPSLLGASLFGKYPLISLLPWGRKLKRREEEKKRLFRELLGSALLFLGSLSLAFLLHLNGLNQATQKIEQKLHQLAPQVEEAKQIEASLKLLSHAQASKEKLLLLLKSLSERLPSSIRLRELRMEGGEFLFKGESPSHAFLSETVQALSEIESLEGTQLAETRLRKRLNEDYFEFEITGKGKEGESVK